MKTVTFAFDVQLNDQEDWIAEGTQVEIFDNPVYLARYKNSIPVVIREAYNYQGEKIGMNPTVEWFMNSSFKELR